MDGGTTLFYIVCRCLSLHFEREVDNSDEQVLSPLEMNDLQNVWESQFSNSIQTRLVVFRTVAEFGRVGSILVYKFYLASS